MGKAELEIAAKMLGGVVHEGEVYLPAPEEETRACEGCDALDNDDCFKLQLTVYRQLKRSSACKGTIWLKAKLK